MWQGERLRRVIRGELYRLLNRLSAVGAPRHGQVRAARPRQAWRAIRSARRPGDGQDQWLDPDAIAETYLHLLQQHRSAWTWEIEVRPWVEKF
jgi:hypothetical protein